MMSLLQKDQSRITIVGKHILNKTDDELKYKRWIKYKQDWKVSF